MKRATLTSYPTNQPSHPADLTDRLLSPESAQPAAPAKKRRARRSRTATAEATPAATPQAPPAPSGAALGAAAADGAAPDAVAPGVLGHALATADAAVGALRTASGEAPARYEVALRYRLDALAYHLQQVKEFVASLASR